MTAPSPQLSEDRETWALEQDWHVPVRGGQALTQGFLGPRIMVVKGPAWGEPQVRVVHCAGWPRAVPPVVCVTPTGHSVGRSRSQTGPEVEASEHRMV